DSRGRLSSFTGPYEIAAGKPYTMAFEYHPDAAVPYAITRHYDPEYDDDIRTITFMDGLGRVIQTKKDGSLFKGKSVDDALDMIVSGGDIYDAFGRVVKTYYPVAVPAGASDTSLSGATGGVRETTTYDVEDREASIVLADGATDKMTYTAGSNLLSTL